MRALNIFFDVDNTLMKADGQLRDHAVHVFQRLVEGGHSIYVWSGLGIRRIEMEKRGLGQFINGYFAKPLSDYRAKLIEFNIPIVPDFVVDDHQSVVEAFGGYCVSRTHGTPMTLDSARRLSRFGVVASAAAPEPAAEEDRELLRVLEAIESFAML